jgi:hypothetical protein
MSSAHIAQKAATGAKAAAKHVDGHVLNKGAKKDPELYVWLRCIGGFGAS